MKSNEFTCAMCGETFEKAWSDEESYAEAKEIFGMEKARVDCECNLVCDDCWQRVRPYGDGHPENKP